MKTIILDQEIKVFYVTATSFPAGIQQAHQQLHELLNGDGTARRFYGISRPENGIIVYKAAAEELTAGEGERLGCESMIIKKGKYVSLTIHDFMKDIPAIEKGFNQLLHHPDLDPNGYCIEEYINHNDMILMIRLQD